KPVAAWVDSSAASRRTAVVLPAPGRPSSRILVGTLPSSPRFRRRPGWARPNGGFGVRTGAGAAVAGMAARMRGIELSSTAFDDKTEIPRRYSGEGENISPPLTWSGVPHEATELVLLCEDPDAPGTNFLHWLVTGIDPGTTGAAE